MASETYFINPLTQVLRDGIDPHYEQLVMQVYSGDYFATLATKLDALLQELPPDSSVRFELQQLVNDLIYLQDHYEII